MSATGLPQEDGKIIVLAPAQAALLVEQLGPEDAARVYTLPGLPEDAAYVIDLDWIPEHLDVELFPPP